MNESEANRQIQQMIAFIRQEAKEKAEEIRVKTENVFMAEKLSLQTQASIKLREEFEKKKKDAQVAKKIERSKSIATSRVSMMRAKEEKMAILKAEVLGQLSAVAGNKQYPTLIKYLLVQGFLTMLEESVVVQCRKEDEKIVKGELAGAVAEYKEKVKSECGVEPPLFVTFDPESLPPAPQKGSQAAACCGGVVLKAKAGKIICRNTLEARLEIAFERLKPEIRGMLFGVRAAPANAFDPSKAAPAHH